MCRRCSPNPQSAQRISCGLSFYMRYGTKRQPRAVLLRWSIRSWSRGSAPRKRGYVHQAWTDSDRDLVLLPAGIHRFEFGWRGPATRWLVLRRNTAHQGTQRPQRAQGGSRRVARSPLPTDGALQGAENMYIQHATHLSQTLEHLLWGRLKDTSYPFVEGQQGVGPNSSLQRWVTVHTLVPCGPHDDCNAARKM